MMSSSFMYGVLLQTRRSGRAHPMKQWETEEARWLGAKENSPGQAFGKERYKLADGDGMRSKRKYICSNEKAQGQRTGAHRHRI